jgi:predicted ATPase
MALIDETIALVDANGDVKYMPELQRVKGAILLAMPEPSVDDAEIHFMQSLELSRRQGARGWELRAATDLAALLSGQGRTESARTLLQPVLEQFVEGLDTKDLKAAGCPLETLS